MNGSIVYEWNGERVIIFAPSNREEAARVLGRCTELAADGRAVRAGVLESPYRPGARFGLERVEAAGHDCDHVTVGRHVHDDEITGGHIAQVEIPLYQTAAEAIEAIEASEASGGDAAIRLLVTLSRMNCIHEISKTDFLAVVDGGVEWNALVSEVENAGLYLPHGGAPCLAGIPGGITVAEIVTGGSSASTDGRFGALREYVLSLEMATPAGGLIHTGSRAVKDVGGYDLAGFLLGEGGRCGVVTRVTLRLLPAPGSRLVIAARGQTGELQALARHVHRRMRPAFIEIYGGPAAALLAGESAEGPAAALRTIEPVENPAGGGAAGHGLLIGELQAPNPGAEEDLLGEAAAAFDGGPKIVRCDPGIVRNRRRFAAVVSDALGGGGDIVYLSLETALERIDRPGTIQYRSLHPHRLHCFLPRDAIDPSDEAGRGDPAEAPRSLLDVLKSFGADSPPGLRSEVVLFYRCNGSLRYRRIHRDDFDRPVSAVFTGAGAGAERESRRRDAFDLLWQRARKVFDPQGIMLP